MGKGDRRERQAVSLLQRAGYATYRPATVRFGENDMFGLFDVMAMAPHRPPRAVQVKSNRATGIRAWTRHTSLWRAHGFLTEYWVPVDNRGWRVIAARDNGHMDVYDGRGSPHAIGDGLVRWLQSDTDGSHE